MTIYLVNIIIKKREVIQMKDFFANLKINQEFKIISKATSNNENDLIMVYKKVSKSKAECIDQIGYNNNRLVGGLFPFSANIKVTL